MTLPMTLEPRARLPLRRRPLPMLAVAASRLLTRLSPHALERVLRRAGGGARPATHAEAAEYPGLYEQERPVEAEAGSLLLFVGDIVHRGSAYNELLGRRLALFFNMHGAQARWTDKHLWSMRPAHPNWNTLHELMVELDPRQRHLLGFPPPGDDYWTDETIGHLERMYPGIDSKPYLPPTPAQVPAPVAP
ncbi:hypothetical protein [Streptomyces sp. NPDC058304]|uniref:hypothetical protein n=1 Tax=Streptomyces sp. NPDC058304 TaxID=3346437 RepID=UPI0036F13E5C